MILRATERSSVCGDARRTFLHFALCILCSLLGMLAFCAAAQAQVWRGTAPFCKGACLPGETQVATSSTGDGGTCWTGHKVKCQKVGGPQACPARETKVSCYVFVEICDNGYYETPSSAWHSCNKYACGGCFGSSAANTSPADGSAQASLDLSGATIHLQLGESLSQGPAATPVASAAREPTLPVRSPARTRHSQQDATPSQPGK